jgi:hypothetical protein
VLASVVGNCSEEGTGIRGLRAHGCAGCFRCGEDPVLVVSAAKWRDVVLDLLGASESHRSRVGLQGRLSSVFSILFVCNRGLA